MILLGNVMVNDKFILCARASSEFDGSIVVYSILYNNKPIEGSIRGLTPRQIYQAIEEKSGVMRSLRSENERLIKELKDTEDLYIKTNAENESLRERLNEPKLHQGKWHTKDCPGYMETADGCAGLRIAPEDENDDARIHTMCAGCELFAFFCEPAKDDDGGCPGRRKKNGELFPKCIDCIGLKVEE